MLQKTVDGGRFVVSVVVSDRSRFREESTVREGCWALSHSLAARRALHKISWEVMVLFSKMRRFLAIHRFQQIQGRRLVVIPNGGRLTHLSEACSRTFMEVSSVMLIVKGQISLFHTS